MNKIEEGKKFTDSFYANKEEVKAKYNQADISSIWDNVLYYRSFFDVDTELIDKDNNHYKICLTKGILAQSYNLEIQIIEKLASFQSLPSDLAQLFSIQQLSKSLKQTAVYQGIQASDNIIDKIARKELENSSTNLFPLLAYEKAYRYCLSLKKFDMEGIENINKILTGSSIEDECQYRKDNHADIINPLFVPDYNQIQTQFESLFSFLKQEEIPLLLRALSITYFFSSLRPFAYCNEETAGLVSKVFLLVNHLSYFGFILPLESLSYTTSVAYFQRLKTSEETLDLTYFISSTISFLQYAFDLIQKDFEDIQQKNLERKTETSLKVTDNTSNDVMVKEEIASFALPEFPLSKNEDEIEILSKKLLSVYPQLKRKQAHFFAGHCQVGLNYTIEQFKKEEKTVYETARTSMEDLANRGFYKKLQIGKKFVYTPIPVKEIND